MAIDYRIRKVKLIKGLQCLDIDYKAVELDSGGNAVRTTNYVGRFSELAHEDLLNALYRLIPHLVMLCELADTSDYSPESFHFDLHKAPAFASYGICGFTLGGQDDQQRITIMGKKKLHNKQVFNLNSPLTHTEDPDSDYPFFSQLEADLSRVIREVIAYINGKSAADKRQLAINFHVGPAANTTRVVPARGDLTRAAAGLPSH